MSEKSCLQAIPWALGSASMTIKHPCIFIDIKCKQIRLLIIMRFRTEHTLFNPKCAATWFMINAKPVQEILHIYRIFEILIWILELIYSTEYLSVQEESPGDS